MIILNQNSVWFVCYPKPLLQIVSMPEGTLSLLSVSSIKGIKLILLLLPADSVRNNYGETID